MQRIDIRCEQGQTMAEYAVILAVITVGVLGALIVFSGAIISALERTSSLIQ
jgi:Flp pilus assembly pilin Flp